MGDENPTVVDRVAHSLRTPFSNQVTWLQLAAVVIFVTVVLFAWRQVILMIDAEV